MYVLCGIVILQFLFSNAARILLVAPIPSISTQVVFRPLTHELVRRGHQVVVITTDPAYPKGATPPNLTEIDMHDFSYKKWQDVYAVATGKADDVEEQVKSLYSNMQEVFKEQIQHDHIQNLIRQHQTFDLVVVLAWVRETLLLSHYFKAPVIQLTTIGRTFRVAEDFGVLSHPIFSPVAPRRRLYNLTFWETISQTIFEINHYNMVMEFNESFDEWVKMNIDEDIPNLNDLSQDISMLFTTLHPIWENNQPVPINFQYLWGIHCSQDEKLSEELQSFLNSSDNGVIYMSFGTNKVPSSLPRDKLQMFLNVFSELPYNVVWKWDQSELPGKSKNIKIGKWFPQQNLLKHPKIKLFITQGGLQSTTEAILAKVPLIGIPMLSDQWYNIEKYVYHRIGIQLDIETLTEEHLRKAINTIMTDKSYSENVRKLGSIVSDQPQSALERAAWWVQHVLRHDGARHLRAPAANISWAEYYEIELISICLTFTIITIFVFAKIAKVVCNLVGQKFL